MKMMLNKVTGRYRETPDELKASIWYAVGNIVQKAAPWLVMFILTHYLATKEYGVYTTFMSWLEIMEIVVTLRIYSNGYLTGLVHHEEDGNLYTASMQSLCFVLTAAWLIIYLLFHRWIDAFTEISMPLGILMICSFLGTAGYGLWSARQRMQNHYKRIFAVSVLYGLAGPVTGALSVFCNFKNPVFYVIFIRTAIQLFVAIPFFASNYKGSSAKWDKRYTAEALKFNIPLMPYYLSMVLLNHSDRLMIQKMKGYEEAAVYSVAYSVSMMVFVVSGAINLSLQAWMLKALKENDNRKDKSRMIKAGTVTVAFFSALEMILAPELIAVFGGKKYTEAVWVVPPLVICVIVMYIYQQYLNVLFYFGKTKWILIASVASALCNIGMNAIFIPAFGYTAAGYTSMVSYLFVMSFYFVIVKKECRREGIEMEIFFDTPFQMAVLLASLALAFSMMFLYKTVFLRCGIAVVITIAGLFVGIKGKQIMPYKRKKVRPVCITLLAVLAAVLFCPTAAFFQEKYEMGKCPSLYADKVYAIPGKDGKEHGFTCTGLFYDEKQKQFYIGNIGKERPGRTEFHASIEIVDRNFSCVSESIECYKVFKNMGDIQGVCMDREGRIWICSYAENLVRQIDRRGRPISEFPVDAPSGIACDNEDGTLWVLTNKYLIHYTKKGEVLKKIPMEKEGQDQLFLDSVHQKLYISAGDNYYGDSYIYTADLTTGQITLCYVLKDSYAIEGITLIGNELYVLNDGYYHDAKIPFNQVNVYRLP
ncbi:hypothetical protein D7V86_08475 [bacterium D16-51]|nr:hypothetical protein D7V96_08460 [bacterium D16-59]RKI60626.1 hypothetical protein D7V86_08475 [bacterium D16-51]